MIRLYIDQGMDGVKGVLSIQSVIDENDGEVKARRDLSIQLVQSTSLETSCPPRRMEWSPSSSRLAIVTTPPGAGADHDHFQGSVIPDG